MSHAHHETPTTGSQKKLSEQLHALAATFKDRAVTLGEVIDTLDDKASSLVMLICAMPFMVPFSLPGLSTPLGAIILTLSFTFLFGGKPWLPKRIREKELPPKFFAKVLEVGSRVLAWFEKHLRERHTWLCTSTTSRRFHAVIMIFSTLLLMLPLPPFPPLTNTLPALVVVIIVMSLITRDGLGVIAGYVMFFITVAYFIIIGTVVIAAVEKILEYAQRFLA